MHRPKLGRLMRGSSSILGTIHIFSTSTKFRLGMLNVGRGHISPRLSGVLSGLRRGIMVLGFVHNFGVVSTGKLAGEGRIIVGESSKARTSL